MSAGDGAEPGDRGDSQPAEVIVREAGRGDIAALLDMFAELAEYEDLTQELQATPQTLAEALFAQHPPAQALVAERDSAVIGYALFFSTFSSFLAKPGVWLEDLYVRPAQRRQGAGRALLAAVAELAVRRGAGRLEWAALDWNEPALSFYRALGARTMPQWITHRLTGAELRALAAAR